ncbi:MAG: VOC family protein [Dehalococcoidia bacterium]
MSEEKLRIEHMLQPALLCRDIDRTMDFLHAMLGIFPSERVDIKNTGVNNAVYALDGMTFLELIEPYDPGCAAMRLMDRFGEGWHMLSVDLAPMEPKRVEALLDEAQVRVVRENSNQWVHGAWHLHPGDTLGVLLALFLRADRDDNGRFAGWAWREYVATNTRFVHSIPGVSIAVRDLDAAAAAYTRLGFVFGDRRDDAGDAVLQCDTPRGTWLQLRQPMSDAAPSAAQVGRRPGLFHMAFDTPDLGKAAQAVERVGGQIARETNLNGQRAFWTVPETTLHVPLEFRQWGRD